MSLGYNSPESKMASVISVSLPTKNQKHNKSEQTQRVNESLFIFEKTDNCPKKKKKITRMKFIPSATSPCHIYADEF